MSQQVGNKQSGWGAYGRVWVVVSKLAIFLAAIFTLVAALIYCARANEIERIANRTISPIWTCLLLPIPLVIQGWILIKLHKEIESYSSEHTIRTYFVSYFWKMSVSLFSYTSLWLAYVLGFSLNAGDLFANIFSWLSPILIIVLIGFIVHTTYIITKRSFRDHKLLISEEEVNSNYTEICQKLKSYTTETKLIKEWLLKDRDWKIHVTVNNGNIDHLDSEHLTEALNRLIRNRRFNEELPQERRNGQSDPPLQIEIESVNRKYLNDYLLVSTTTTTTAPVSTTQRVEANTKEEKKEDEERIKLYRQEAQREGMAKYPFYTLVFFFSVFLCIAYLFGFAFAFEDKHVQLSDPKRQVALFMTDDLLEDVAQQTGSALFRVGDFKNLPNLAIKLHNSSDVLSSYLLTQLTPRTQELLKEYDGSRPLSESLQNALIEELNKVLKGKSLFDEKRFEPFNLRDETKKLVGKDLSGEDMIHFNRLLLEDAYPVEIIKSQQATLLPTNVAYRLNKQLQKVFYFNSGGGGD